MGQRPAKNTQKYRPEACATLIQQPVPVVALVWFVAEVLDEPVHVSHGHAEGGARLADDVFLDHDAAEIVRAELEGDVGEIIEVDPAQRLRPQIVVCAHRRRLELRALGLERPADESGEVAG